MKTKTIHKDTENMNNAWTWTVSGTLCGSRASHLNVQKVEDWDKVTCKACLKQRRIKK